MHTVLGVELIRGVVDDLVWIANGYPPAFYIAWILVHAVIIVTGVRALRSTYSERREDGLLPGMAERDRATDVNRNRCIIPIVERSVIVPLGLQEAGEAFFGNEMQNWCGLSDIVVEIRDFQWRRRHTDVCNGEPDGPAAGESPVSGVEGS